MGLFWGDGGEYRVGERCGAVRTAHSTLVSETEDGRQPVSLWSLETEIDR